MMLGDAGADVIKDVFVESYRRGVPERLGIDYEAVRKVNPQSALSYSGCAGHDP